jgi:cyclin A
MEGETFLSFPNSHIGASAVALARHTLRLPAWPEEMVQLSGLAIDVLKPCLVCLHEVFTKAPAHQQQAIREKYKQSRFVNLVAIPENRD